MKITPLLLLITVVFAGTPAVLSAGRASSRTVEDSSKADSVLDAQRAKYRKLGDLYYRSAGCFMAYENYRRLADTGVDDPEIYYRLGYCARDLRRTEKAEEWFRKAADAYTERTGSKSTQLDDWYRLASVQGYLGDRDASKEVAEQAVALYRKKRFGEELSGADWFRLSRLYGFANRPADAEEAMQQAVDSYRRAGEVDDDDLYYETVMTGRARRAMAGGMYEEASRLYQEIRERRPRAPGVGYELGLSRLRSGDVEGALDAWEAARRQDPAKSTEAGYAYNLLARIADYQRRHPEAEPISIEEPYAGLDRAGLEGAVVQSLQELSDSMQRLRAEQGGDVDPISGEALSSNPLQAEVDRRGAELAAVLLAYQLRGLPVREVASQHRLLGWIFARRAGS